METDSDKPSASKFLETSAPSCAPLSQFHEMSVEEVEKVIAKSSNATCSLDAHPTWFLKNHLDSHIPAITDIVNKSLSSGVFPSAAHHTLVTPLLKKPSLNKDEFKNYRPVSNLSFVAKVIEKCASEQFVEHLNENNMCDPLQSAYRAQHSCESALMKVQDDIMCEIDSKRAVFVVLLDMSAAFDTVDHAILLQRLDQKYAVNGTALTWFKSYLGGWSSSVNINGTISAPVTTVYGLPQGSVLGPLLFTAYSKPIGEIARKHGIEYHQYADDSQLYVSFDPRDPEDMARALNKISCCIADIKSCLSANYLKLNDSKTEFFVAASNHSLKLLDTQNTQLTIGDSTINLSSVIRNLGCHFDSNMSLTAHVNVLRRNILFQMKNLWRIRRYINKETCHHAVRALILQRLDYCNALYLQLSANDISRLQRLQNSAARIIFAVGRRVEAQPLISSLHWLTIEKRIIFKILLYIYKSINNIAPNYISNKLTPYEPGRTLRSSSDTTRLLDDRCNIVAGERRFPVAGVKRWNSLKKEIRLSSSVTVFKKRLKAHLF